MAEKDFLKKIVRRFRNHLGNNLVSIVLFGSQARGDSNTTSDYDLFIVARKLPKSPLIQLVPNGASDNPSGNPTNDRASGGMARLVTDDTPNDLS